MNTRLVLWGEIGTDRKALIALFLDEPTTKIHIYAFPKEEVSKEIQDQLFVEWKNGGEFTFPESAHHWEIDANSDTILPEEVKPERVDLVLQSQHKWSKKLMSAKINQMLADETQLLEEQANVISDYDKSLWDKTKTQWEKIASYQKKNEITWEQTTVLKEKINGIFDALKAMKRLNTENEDQANSVFTKQIQKRIEDLQSKLIYSDQWKHIFDELKKIQNEIKDVTMRWSVKKNIYASINQIFDDLRKYRSTETVTKTQNRIVQLKQILDGLKDSIARDTDNLNMQIEKMQHYTRGKLGVDEIKNRFNYLTDRIKDKEKKADGIKDTIKQLEKEIEKEKQEQTEREEQRKKREEEQAQKEHTEKGAAKSNNKADESTAVKTTVADEEVQATTATEENHAVTENMVSTEADVTTVTDHNTIQNDTETGTAQSEDSVLNNELTENSTDEVKTTEEAAAPENNHE